MANRRFENGIWTFEPDVVELWAVVTIGAAGACTLTRGKGITSVTRVTTGQYYLTLADKYNRFMGGSITPMRASTYAHIIGQFEGEDVAGAGSGAWLAGSTEKTICFSTWEGTGFIDPTSGTVLYITVKVKNSSAIS